MSAVIDLALDKGWGAHIKVVVADTPAADAAAAAFLRKVVTPYVPGENYHVASIDWDAMEKDANVGRCLDAYFHPTCEHGMSLHLCAGPQHYPYDEEERQVHGY